MKTIDDNSTKSNDAYIHIDSLTKYQIPNGVNTQEFVELICG